MNTTGKKLQFGKDIARWKKLLDKIDEGNVIPVIGPDLLVDPIITQDKDGMQIKENMHQQIISYIASQLEVESHPRTFSQLVYDPVYRHNVEEKNWIYSLISQTIEMMEDVPTVNSKPSQMLMDLLGTKKFPFVITTSFTPIVENAMREIWGKVKVLKFNNNPADSSWERGGDIRTEEELKQPTVYYMFGKVCDDTQNARYVVTDADMMKFCSSWIKGNGIPQTLANALKNKYLLILGNNYSDWLFRFVWYSLRSKTEVLESSMKEDVIVRRNAETTFKQFLDRLETLFQENPEEVIRRIKDDMEKRIPNQKTLTLPNTGTDVFISYSRSDRAIAEKLYSELRAAGMSVWFDDQSIPRGDAWKQKIEDGIKRARLFVPILSHHLESESIKEHEYRDEWSKAAQRANNMGGRKFILPFAKEGFDFYDQLTNLPKAFMEKNATWYKNDEDTAEICKVIKEALAEVKELEKKYTNA